MRLVHLGSGRGSDAYKSTEILSENSRGAMQALMLKETLLTHSRFVLTIGVLFAADVDKNVNPNIRCWPVPPPFSPLPGQAMLYMAAGRYACRICDASVY
jgi:hypothetical protein